jgi:hypothetical protein
MPAAALCTCDACDEVEVVVEVEVEETMGVEVAHRTICQ